MQHYAAAAGLQPNYPYLHSSHLSALSAAMNVGGNVLHSAPGGFNPALFQAAVGNNNSLGSIASSRSPSFLPGLHSATHNQALSSLLSSSSISSLNPYANFFPYAAAYNPYIAAAAAAKGSEGIPGASTSSMALAERLYRQSAVAFSKSLGEAALSRSGAMSTSPTSSSMSGASSMRYSPYKLPHLPPFGMVGGVLRPSPTSAVGEGSNSSRKFLGEQTTPRNRLASGTSNSPSSPRSPEYHPIRRDSSEYDMRRQPERKGDDDRNTTAGGIGSAVQELRNMERLVSGLEQRGRRSQE